ncbi:MAG: hypothetical protein Q8N95_01350 [Desulfobacterales bacterium]|nr:hypothetical protein [Desulfobacterales bacterium]
MEKMIQMRSAAGKIAALVCILFSLSIIDAVIAGFRQSANVFDLLPGTTVEINGIMMGKVKSAREITWTGNSNHILLTIDSIQKGHWFGDNMWQGRLTIDPDIRAGEYSLTVGIEGMKMQKPGKFLIRVYNDYAGYRQSFKSFIKRYLNISPWILAASFFIPVVPVFVYIFFLSGKIEQLMAKQGKAVVYRVKKGDDGCEIAFSLGTAHGIRTDTSLALLNEEGKPAGTVVVHNVSETDSVARVGPGCTVKPGYMVSLSGR